jgi:tetratricopeptide (TPR) repeat protein
VDQATSSRVRTLIDLRRLEQAETMLGEHLASQPDDPDALRLLALTLLQLDRAQEAVDVGVAAVAAAPGHYLPLIHLSTAYARLRQPGPALEAADRAVALAPHVSHTYYVRAGAGRIGKRRQWRQALADATEACRLAPDYAPNHVQLGLCHLRLAHYGSAREAFMQALRLDPADQYAMNNLAVLDLRGGRISAATGHLTAGLAVNPQTSVLRNNFDAVLLARLQRFWWAVMAFSVVEVVAVGLKASWPVRACLGLVILMAAGVVGRRVSTTLPPATGLILRGMWGRLKWRARLLLSYWALGTVGLLLMAFAPRAVALAASEVTMVVLRILLVSLATVWVTRMFAARR